MSKQLKYDGKMPAEALTVLDTPGNTMVSPTKVGYIIMTADRAGLDVKFQVKKRPERKPGVVLCSGIDQLKELAELNDDILKLYEKHWEQDILLGCILPWKKEAMNLIPDDGSKERMMDARETSCFVIRFGKPSEEVVTHRWNDGKKLTFASSANESGKGNMGVFEGIGERILGGVTVAVEADDFVKSIQPTKTKETRHEQGVMVSMVEEDGSLT
ncbi:MAG: Sua5/YciO/YrdC/YwlC family protein, partial [Alphaproteobacteria bacterium]